MKSKTQKKLAVSSKINEFFNENIGLSAAGTSGTMKTQVLFSMPTGSFIQEALDFRLNGPTVTEITLWKVGSGKRIK